MNVTVFADEALIRQILINLISNAIKYSSEKSIIEIEIKASDVDYFVRIKNACHHIPREDRSRFFDYFYRGDPARNRNIEGSGLGLNVALEIAKSHGGKLYLEETDLEFVEVTLFLPKQ